MATFSFCVEIDIWVLKHGFFQAKQSKFLPKILADESRLPRERPRDSS